MSGCLTCKRYAADTGKNWNGITAGNPADVRELSTLELLLTDGVLYRAGIYNSPDLSVPLWDKIDSLLTAAGAALIVLFMVHPGRGKPRRNH